MGKKKEEAKVPSVSLIDLNSQFQAVASQLMAAGGELTPESEANLDRICTELCAKADGYGIVMEKLESQVDFWKYQKEKCAQAQNVFTNAIERLKKRMRLVLNEMPGETLQGDLYRFFLCKAQDTLDIDEHDLPQAYKKVQINTVPDKEKIEAALKRGETIPGVTVKKNKALRQGRPQ